MTLRARHLGSLSAAVLAAVLTIPVAAAAQDARGGFLDNLFNGGQTEQRPVERTQMAQAEGSDTSMRIDRVENALRQLTGTVEELQHQNQQLQLQLKRMQDDTEYRFQQLSGRGAPASNVGQPPAVTPTAPTNITPGASPPDHSDAFNPALHPNAPGAGRTLNAEAGMPAGPPRYDDTPVGAPGGRAAGAPLDLSSLATPPGAPPSARPMTPPSSQLPPPSVGAGGTQLATLPPSSSPKDEYELAYGYVLHKDYPLAEQALRDFLRKYPDEQLVPEAQYWLGESLFQRQRYRDAAESFLAVSTKYAHSPKAPNSLLRLGQSLAALHQKEAACATLAEVARKYPRASANVKRSVAQELKRVHC